MIHLLVMILLFSSQSFSCPHGYDIPETFVTDAGGISEEEFMRISTELENLYASDIANRGGKLHVYKEWKSSEVNAYAQRQDGEWKVIMLGGIARHKYMTADGFALVTCHELGHHLGGFPKFDGIDTGWASNEGQSDYYSTMKCLRRYWENADNEAAISGKMIPPTLQESCRGEALCIRSGLAGLSVSYVFSALAWNLSKPKFETPDPKVVKATYFGHPKPQCRLDTFFQGSICEASSLEDMATETKGSCHETLGYTRGMRPRCWFKPTL
jgi:hypothetical protein